MIFPLGFALVLTLALLLLAALGAALRWLWRRPPGRYWRIVGWLAAGGFLLHLFVTFPVALGLLGSRGLGTRHDERGYQGPRLSAAGQLLVQDSKSLRRESDAGAPEVPAAVAAAAAARARTIRSADGVPLRLFRLEAKAEPPRAAAVLVHGLFRSAMELEPVAALLRDAGCECWLLELRNHGGSGRAPFTAGLRESYDVVAAVEHVRAEPGREAVPVLLFGVSLGTAAVSLALPRLPGLGGVVLDAPIDDVHAAAHRMLGFDRSGDRRAWFRVDEPWRTAVLAALGACSGFDPAAVCPSDVLATLPHDLPVLVVGAGEDDRAPPDTVERLFERLPTVPERKLLWLHPAAGHGRVFLVDPEGYRQRLQWLLARLRR